MKNMKKLLALLLALIMVVGLVACGEPATPETPDAPDQTQGQDTPDATEEATDAPVAEGPKYGGHLDAHVYSKTSNVDPLKSTGIWRYVWTTCVYENALTRDNENNIRPAVCEFELTEDQLELKLWVREGVTFSNGDAVDIYDVEASINRALNLYSSIVKKVTPNVESVVVDDADKSLTIKFHTYSEDNMYYLAAVQTWAAIMPKEICEKYPEDFIGENVEDAIGTGPYVIENMETDVSITLRKRDNYVPFENDYTGLAATKYGYMDTITFWHNGDNSSATLALLSGDYDMTDVVDTSYLEMAAEQGIVLDKLPSDVGTAIIFNTAGANNICAKYPDLRKAVMAAIDYEEFLNVVTDGAYVMGTDMILDPQYESHQFMEVDYYGPANPEVAAKYLEAAYAAGYNGEPVQIQQEAAKGDIMTMLKGYMDAAGIPCEVTGMEEGALSEFRSNVDNNWDFFFTWPTYKFTPTTLMTTDMNKYWTNERKDQLIEEMKPLVSGTDEYVAKWNELIEIMVDDCASVHMGTIYWYIYHPSDLIVEGRDNLAHYDYYNIHWENPEEHTS